MAEFTWAELNERLRDMTEAQAWKALEDEKAGRNRISHLLRIYGRAGQLRSARERRELIGTDAMKKGKKRED